MLWYTSNESISDEKALLTFLSNLNRSLLIFAVNTRGHSYEDIGLHVLATQNEEMRSFYKRNRGIQQWKRGNGHSWKCAIIAPECFMIMKESNK